MKDNKLCLVLGSGATFDSGYKVSEKNNFINLCNENRPPMDYNFFQQIILNENSFKALPLILPKLKLSSMEDVWSFFDCAYKIRSKEKKDIEYLRTSKFSDKLLSWGFSNIESFSDFWNNLNTVFNNNRNTSIVSGENPLHSLTGELGREFRRLIFSVYSHLIPPDDSANNIKNLLKIIDPELTNIITFNYDLLIEKNIINNKFSYVVNNNDVKDYKLIKLHGSLNWLETNNNVEIRKLSDVEIEPVFRSLRNYNQPAIVPPTLTKNETKEADNTEISNVICSQWEAARKVLEDVNKIIFIGYGFPSTDNHAIDLFSDIFKDNNVKILYCIKGKKDELRKKFKEVNNENITICSDGFSGLLNSNDLKDF